MKLRSWHLRGVAALAAWSLSALGASEAGPSAGADGINDAGTNALAPSAPSDTNTSPATAIQPAQIALPPDLAEVVRLAESGLGDEVILAYIRKSSGTSPITADQIVYLRDLGISTAVLQSLIEHRPLDQGQAGEPAMAPTVPATAPSAETVAPSVPPPPPGVDSSAPGPAPAPNTSDYGYYYNSLAPYGTWLDLPGYGWCWQPTVVAVNPTWQPYCQDGYWAWSDCGWYWNSYYSWGWAPFHYGRWCSYRPYGWVWCPDRVWGPAWVCWRQGPGCCGWAPLPPGTRFTGGTGWTFKGVAVGQNFGFGLAPSTFTFVGYEHFYDRRPFEHRLPAREASTVFKQTTVNNDFVVAANGRLINRGVDPQRIADAARMPIRPVAVRDLEASRHAFRTPSGSWMTINTRPANARADSMAARGNAPGGSRKNETVLSKWPALPNSAPPSPVGQQPVRPVSPTYSVPRYEPVAPRGGGAVPAHSEAH